MKHFWSCELLLCAVIDAGNAALCDVMLLASGLHKVRASRLRFDSHEDQQRINGMLHFCIRLVAHSRLTAARLAMPLHLTASTMPEE